MGLLKSKSGICPVDQHCAEWARRYLGCCFCSTKDGFSMALGLISVISWSVAEIPQIVTNYRQKSAEGLSILFLLTWIIGDLFNVFGCLLEPATLPTQYYTALLYTITTLILSGQAGTETAVVESRMEDNNEVERREIAPSSPIHFPLRFPKSSEELYFMSARSLSVSHSPIMGSFPPRTPTSDIERHWFKEPLLGRVRSTHSASFPKLKTMLSVVSLTTCVLVTCNRQLAESHKNSRIFKSPVRRQLLHAKATGGSAAESSRIGSFLGWGMTVIYLGGRLPQICLNIRRGNAEGLNPLMFVFALIGNATYVASILVNSLDWLNVRPNLPWLVDAGGCVLLDTFILMQFIYFRYQSTREDDKYVS
ncbi:hypothetical protein CDL12_21025 [Handroanthus impetiginosus]|uniref:PQ-loop repeat family protein / transmembrane family protein n=1 Tax=Handroanthus impetiginosus TaxID=429701 RepID=A0A2G9GM98_9LAMI|nr:hypothetical protein CDL12_21025 [Handroanthus impetiginosus]